MKRVIFLALAAALVLQPATVDAQVFNGTPLDLEYQTFLSGSGQGSTYGVQVGPYRSRFEANLGTGRTAATLPFSVYCVDFLHYASNSTGLVNVTGITDGGDFSNTRLGAFGAYRQSAYLASLFDSWTTYEADLENLFGGDFTKKHVWGGLHAAIWNVTTGPDDLGGTGNNTADARGYFLGLANDNAGSFDTSGWYVLSEADLGVTLADGNSGQEFLMRAAVPEPSVIFLLFTGMVLLVGVNRKRLVGTYA